MHVPGAPHLEKSLKIVIWVPINSGKRKRCWRLRTDEEHESTTHSGTGRYIASLVVSVENEDFQRSE